MLLKTLIEAIKELAYWFWVLLWISYPLYLFIFYIERNQARRVGRPAFVSWSTFIIYLVFTIPSLSLIVHFQHLIPRPIESESWDNLRSIYRHQEQYKAQHGVFATSPDIFKKLNWEYQGGYKNKYAYYCGDEVFPPGRGDVDNYPRPGPDWPYPNRAFATETSFACLAICNIDWDSAPDILKIGQDGNLVHVYKDVSGLYHPVYNPPPPGFTLRKLYNALWKIVHKHQLIVWGVYSAWALLVIVGVGRDLYRLNKINRDANKQGGRRNSRQRR